jgi:hypothetical protein
MMRMPFDWRSCEGLLPPLSRRCVGIVEATFLRGTDGQIDRASSGDWVRHRFGRDTAAGTLDRNHRERCGYAAGRLAASSRGTDRGISKYFQPDIG